MKRFLMLSLILASVPAMAEAQRPSSFGISLVPEFSLHMFLVDWPKPEVPATLDLVIKSNRHKIAERDFAIYKDQNGEHEALTTERCQKNFPVTYSILQKYGRRDLSVSFQAHLTAQELFQLKKETKVVVQFPSVGVGLSLDLGEAYRSCLNHVINLSEVYSALDAMATLENAREIMKVLQLEYGEQLSRRFLPSASGPGPGHHQTSPDDGSKGGGTI